MGVLPKEASGVLKQRSKHAIFVSEQLIAEHAIYAATPPPPWTPRCLDGLSVERDVVCYAIPSVSPVTFARTD